MRLSRLGSRNSSYYRVPRVSVLLVKTNKGFEPDTNPFSMHDFENVGTTLPGDITIFYPQKEALTRHPCRWLKIADAKTGRSFTILLDMDTPYKIIDPRAWFVLPFRAVWRQIGHFFHFLRWAV